MGERSHREAGRCAILSDLVTCSGMTPSPVGPCVLHRPADSVPAQQPHSCHTDRLHCPLHTRAHPHTTSHTHNITHPHTLLTHSTNTHSSHPHTHILFTHTHTLTYSHPHTLLIHSYTYSSYPHKHTPSHTPYFHTHTHTHAHTYRAYRSTDTGNTETQGLCSHTRHVECVETAQSPRWGQSLDLSPTGSHWDS